MLILHHDAQICRIDLVQLPEAIVSYESRKHIALYENG